jgi:hypothetical protein
MTRATETPLLLWGHPGPPPTFQGSAKNRFPDVTFASTSLQMSANRG